MSLTRRDFMVTAGKGAAAAGILAASGAKLGADPLGIPIGSQTYPVRARIANGEFVQVLKDMYAAGIRQIELCSPGYMEFRSLTDGKQTRKMIEDNGLKCISAHFSYAADFRDGLPKSIQWAQDVGLTQMGTASLPANMGTQAAPIITMSAGLTSEESIKRGADAYGKIGQQTKAAGIQLFLHNEGFENSRTHDGRLTYPLLLSALDPDLVKMQFQMSSMRVIGNPITYFNLYPGRFISAHVHGVDLTQPPPAPRGNPLPIKPTPEELAAQAAAQAARAAGAGRAGAGARGAGAPAAGRGPGAPAVAVGDDSVNWPAVFTAAKVGGLKNYFIEQEQANGGWEAMVKGAAYLKTLTVT
jgi:sugar phosphate isomerase/epimerase